MTEEPEAITITRAELQGLTVMELIARHIFYRNRGLIGLANMVDDEMKRRQEDLDSDCTDSSRSKG